MRSVIATLRARACTVRPALPRTRPDAAHLCTPPFSLPTPPGPCPKGAGPSPQEQPSDPWPGACGSGTGDDTFTSGFEGAWTADPTVWGNEYFTNLLDFEWDKVKSPGGSWQVWRGGVGTGAFIWVTMQSSDAEAAE